MPSHVGRTASFAAGVALLLPASALAGAESYVPYDPTGRIISPGEGFRSSSFRHTIHNFIGVRQARGRVGLHETTKRGRKTYQIYGFGAVEINHYRQTSYASCGNSDKRQLNVRQCHTAWSRPRGKSLAFSGCGLHPEYVESVDPSRPDPLAVPTDPEPGETSIPDAPGAEVDPNEMIYAMDEGELYQHCVGVVPEAFPREAAAVANSEGVVRTAATDKTVCVSYATFDAVARTCAPRAIAEREGISLLYSRKGDRWALAGLLPRFAVGVAGPGMSFTQANGAFLQTGESLRAVKEGAAWRMSDGSRRTARLPLPLKF